MPTGKTCGNCQNFIRVKAWNTWRNGLCDILDWNCHSDCQARDCKKYRAIKYDRKKENERNTHD